MTASRFEGSPLDPRSDLYAPGLLLYEMIAEMLGSPGDLEGCIAALERAVAAGLEDLAWIDPPPALAAVRDDPRCAQQREILRARAAELLRAWDDS